MIQTAIIVSKWENETEFQKLKQKVSEEITEIHDFYFLFLIKKKQLKEVEVIKNAYFITRRDFSLFGQLKNQRIKKLVSKEESKVLIVAMEDNSPILSKIMKNSQLFSIGIKNELLPTFNFSVLNSKLKNGEFFKQINNYLTKIQF